MLSKKADDDPSEPFFHERECDAKVWQTTFCYKKKSPGPLETISYARSSTQFPITFIGHSYSSGFTILTKIIKRDVYIFHPTLAGTISPSYYSHNTLSYIRVILYLHSSYFDLKLFAIIMLLQIKWIVVNVIHLFLVRQCLIIKACSFNPTLIGWIR